ncbi:MAG: phosphatidylserine decarboxylase [Bacteroidales bacterium]|nr:phosphatidylserine decarboxylase [Bacteroidales bacterium]
MKNTKFRWCVTKLAGRLSRITKPYWLIKVFIKKYIKFYSVDLSDTEFEFKKGISFHDFFTRPLKQNLRIINSDFISPADSVIASCGMSNQGKFIQAKGIDFSFQDLTQSNFQSDNLSYAVFYLSPADYHRFHAPFDMHVKSIVSIGGTCFSVNEKSAEKRKNLYCRNERVVLHGESKFGEFWLVLVGAMVVGSVYLNFIDDCNKIEKSKQINCDYKLKLGDELGYFALGSTVIVCLDSPLLSEIKIPLKEKVKMGDAII